MNDNLLLRKCLIGFLITFLILSSFRPISNSFQKDSFLELTYADGNETDDSFDSGSGGTYLMIVAVVETYLMI